MDMRPTNEPPDPDTAASGDEFPAEAFSPVVDPGLIPGPSPDEEESRKTEEEEPA